MVTQNQKNQDSFNTFLSNYFNIILAVVLIIFLLAAYFLVLGPKYQTTLSTIKDSITQHQLLYNAQKKKLADLKAISDLYKKIDPSDLKKFNTILSDAYVKESLFGEIEEIVSQNGFIINDIKLTRPEEADSGYSNGATSTPLAPNLGEIDINLSLSTIDYAGFKNLIKIFETNLRLMDISQVKFSAADSTANLTLRTYYYKKNAQ